MKDRKFSVGQRVTYSNGYKTEKGIVKSHAPNGGFFVVYNCGGDWKNYRNYTAANTNERDLKAGW